MDLRPVLNDMQLDLDLSLMTSDLKDLRLLETNLRDVTWTWR